MSADLASLIRLRYPRLLERGNPLYDAVLAAAVEEQGKADVVLVPREELSELRAFARISGYPEGCFSFEVPFDRDFADWGTSIAHRMKITREEVAGWLDTLRSTPAPEATP